MIFAEISDRVNQLQKEKVSGEPEHSPVRETPSDEKTKPASPDTSSLPTAYRPGRLNSIQILERIFPLQKRSVLDLVLQGCNGDLVKAIEHFISAQDTITAQNQGGGTQIHSHIECNPPPRMHPYLSAFSSASRTERASLGGASPTKSAFTPLGRPNGQNIGSVFPALDLRQRLQRSELLSSNNVPNPHVTRPFLPHPALGMFPAPLPFSMAHAYYSSQLPMSYPSGPLDGRRLSKAVELDSGENEDGLRKSN